MPREGTVPLLHSNNCSCPLPYWESPLGVPAQGGDGAAQHPGLRGPGVLTWRLPRWGNLSSPATWLLLSVIASGDYSRQLNATYILMQLFSPIFLIIFPKFKMHIDDFSLV